MKRKKPRLSKAERDGYMDLLLTFRKWCKAHGVSFVVGMGRAAESYMQRGGR